MLFWGVLLVWLRWLVRWVLLLLVWWKWLVGLVLWEVEAHHLLLVQGVDSLQVALIDLLTGRRPLLPVVIELLFHPIVASTFQEISRP